MNDAGDPRDPIPPPLSEALANVVKRILYRTRNGMGRAANRGRDRLERRQAQRDLDHFWVRLGKTAYRLVEGGEVDHPALHKAIARIEELERRIAQMDASGDADV